MSDTDKTISFREREFKGSRLRCLLLTSQAPNEVARFLTSLVAPHAEVISTDQWAPRGLLEPDEAKLGETIGFLSEQDRQTITAWWLAKPGKANTPNWDLVSRCRINDKQGLILIEAKAHEAEFNADPSVAKSSNRESIEIALGKATNAWKELLSGFALSAASHYQLSNRFAFAWKVAELGTPVVLIYLGFLNANEMGSSYCLLKSYQQWRDCVVKKSAGVVPKEVWGKTFNVDGTPLTILIRSAEVTVEARVSAEVIE
jgi:hypothetical protein